MNDKWMEIERTEYEALFQRSDHYKALAEYWKSRCEAAEKVIASIEHPGPKLSIPEYEGAKIVRANWIEIKNVEPK